MQAKHPWHITAWILAAYGMTHQKMNSCVHILAFAFEQADASPSLTKWWQQ
jgi:hypothetical protein